MVRPREFDPDEALDKAMHLFWERGFQHTSMEDLVRRTGVSRYGLYGTFGNKDAVGTLKLGQARGVALLVPAQFGLPIGEYAPNKVKKTVVGVGHADKRQVDHMVKMQLPGVQIVGPDAADALAIAICHSRHLGGRELRIRA